MEHILLFLQGKFSIGYRVSQKKHSYKNFWTRDHTLHLLAESALNKEGGWFFSIHCIALNPSLVMDA